MILSETKRYLAEILASTIVTVPDVGQCYVLSEKRFDELVEAAHASGRLDGIESMAQLDRSVNGVESWATQPLTAPPA